MAVVKYPMAMAQHPMAIPWRYVAIPWLSHGGGWIDPGQTAGSPIECELFSFRFGLKDSKSLYKSVAYRSPVTDY